MADKYIYAVARIRALEMSLMSQAAIEQLVATDSYKKAVQFIIEKGWGDSDNASMDENDILRAETDKTWAAVAEMVNDMSVFDVIRLPDLYHNLKAAIKTVVAGETPAHVFFDNSEIDGQKMLSIVSDKAWDRLPEHMRDCAREAWDCMAQAGDGQMCDAVIDRGTLLAIMQAAKKADDRLLRDYAETTVAVADIKIAVRSMKTGKNKDFMKRAMAECNTLDIDRLATAAVAGMEEIERYLADTAYAGGAEALSESANQIVEAVHMVLEKTPPELAADISDRGIVLTGGGALLTGLEQLLEERLGITTMTAEEPTTCVAVGTGKYIEVMNSIRD